MTNTDKRLLSAKEASESLGVTIKTLHRWEKDGYLNPTRTLGGHRRYKRSEIEALLTKEGDAA